MESLLRFVKGESDGEHGNPNRVYTTVGGLLPRCRLHDTGQFVFVHNHHKQNDQSLTSFLKERGPCCTCAAPGEEEEGLVLLGGLRTELAGEQRIAESGTVNVHMPVPVVSAEAQSLGTDYPPMSQFVGRRDHLPVEPEDLAAGLASGSDPDAHVRLHIRRLARHERLLTGRHDRDQRAAVVLALDLGLVPGARVAAEAVADAVEGGVVAAGRGGRAAVVVHRPAGAGVHAVAAAEGGRGEDEGEDEQERGDRGAERGGARRGVGGHGPPPLVRVEDRNVYVWQYLSVQKGINTRSRRHPLSHPQKEMCTGCKGKDLL